MALSPGMADFLIHAGFQVVDMAIAARKSSHEEQDDPVLKQLEARRALLDKMLAQMPAGNLPQAIIKPGTTRPPVRTAPTPSPFMGVATPAQEAWLATPKGQRAKELGALTAYGRNASEETEFQRLRKAYLEAGKTPAEVKVMRAQDKADAALDAAEEKESQLADEEAGAESAVAKVVPEAPELRPIRVDLLPEGWTIRKGKTRSGQSWEDKELYGEQTAIAQMQRESKSLVFKNDEALKDSRLVNHEIAHAMLDEKIQRAPDVLFRQFYDDLEKAAGWGPLIRESGDHGEEAAGLLGDYLNGDVVTAPVRKVFDNYFPQVAPKAAVPTGPARAPQPVALIRPDVQTSTRAPTLASTSQTVELVRRNLAKELYRFELDLTGGLRISGRGCDCGQKHSMGVEAITEELVPMDPRPVYGRILDWLRQHAPEFEPTRVDQTPADYYRGLAAQVRDFRKEVLGTESRLAMLTPEEQEQVKARAQAMRLEKE